MYKYCHCGITGFPKFSSGQNKYKKIHPSPDLGGSCFMRFHLKKISPRRGIPK